MWVGARRGKEYSYQRNDARGVELVWVWVVDAQVKNEGTTRWKWYFGKAKKERGKQSVDGVFTGVGDMCVSHRMLPLDQSALDSGIRKHRSPHLKAGRDARWPCRRHLILEPKSYDVRQASSSCEHIGSVQTIPMVSSCKYED